MKDEVSFKLGKFLVFKFVRMIKNKVLGEMIVIDSNNYVSKID